MRTLTHRLLVAALICGLGPAGARSQVAPATTEVPQETHTEGALSGPVLPARLQPVATILGWSFKDEIEEQPLRRGDGLRLAAGHPEIILFFSTLTPGTRPVEFRYRLNDYDPDWTLTRDRNAHYRRLAPGHYLFQVQARLPGQPWNTAIASVPVIQNPFFYQTWYAGVLVAFGLAALALQLLRQRDQLLKGQIGMVLEERNRIASDCHDTLMAGFAAISWQLETTRQLLGRESGEQMHTAVQACDLAKSMVAHCQAEARRIIWDLRSPEGITDLLSEGLSAALAAHRLSEEVPITFLVEGNEIPISPGAVHHLTCICQEAITNAIRHANAGRIDVRLHFDNDEFSLSVGDNGRGFQAFDTQVRTGHFGISVMEERARKLGGTLRIQSSPEKGTEVTVVVKFQGEYQPITPQMPVLPWIGV